MGNTLISAVERDDFLRNHRPTVAAAWSECDDRFEGLEIRPEDRLRAIAVSLTGAEMDLQSTVQVERMAS